MYKKIMMDVSFDNSSGEGNGVKPPAFRYEAPQTLDLALDLLQQHGDDIKILAGGQSLVPLMNLRLVKPQVLCDINPILSLDFVREEPERIVIGALSRHLTLLNNPTIRRHIPLLAEAAAQIGHLQIRNRGTIGGSLAHADPAAELCTIAMVTDAEVQVQRLGREVRQIPAQEFFVSVFTTSIQPDEMVTAVHMPKDPPQSGSAWLEYSRRPGDFALVGAAVRLTGDGGNRIAAARIGLLGCGPIPIRATTAEAALQGADLTAETFAEAARTAASESDPADDIHATADYRRHLAEVLVHRALLRARERMVTQ